MKKLEELTKEEAAALSPEEAMADHPRVLQRDEGHYEEGP